MIIIILISRNVPTKKVPIANSQSNNNLYVSTIIPATFFLSETITVLHAVAH